MNQYDVCELLNKLNNENNHLKDRFVEKDELLKKQLEVTQNLTKSVDELSSENENWKSCCINMTNENSILRNKISTMKEPDAKLLDSSDKKHNVISTDYDKFWQIKKEKLIKYGKIENKK